MNQLPYKYPVYSKAYYDEAFEEIKKIPYSTSVNDINNFIRHKLGIIIYQYLEHTGVGIEQFPIYRVRSVSKEEQINETQSSEFHYPPIEYCSLGRCNRQGFQVFYSSGDFNTPFIESQDRINVNESTVYLSKWQIKPELKTIKVYYFFLGIDTDLKNHAAIMATGLQENFENHLKNFNNSEKELFIYGQKKLRELFTSETKEYYHITSALAHAVFEELKIKGVNMPIIAYPSVAKSKTSVNFAINKDFVDQYLYVKEIYKGIVTEISKNDVLYSIEAKGYGDSNTNIISWKKTKNVLEPINYSDVVYLFEGEEKMRTLENNEWLTYSNNKIHVEVLLNKIGYSKENILRNLDEYPIKIDKNNFGDNEEKFEFAIPIKLEEEIFLNKTQQKLIGLTLHVKYSIVFN